MADSFFGSLAEAGMAAQEGRRRTALDLAANVWKNREFQQDQERLRIMAKTATDNAAWHTEGLALREALAGQTATLKESQLKIQQLEEERKQRMTDAQIPGIEARTEGQKIKNQGAIDKLPFELMLEQLRADKLRTEIPLLKERTTQAHAMTLGIKEDTARKIANTEEIKQRTKNLGQQYDFNKGANPKKLAQLDANLRATGALTRQRIASTEGVRLLNNFKRLYQTSNGRPATDDMSRVVNNAKQLIAASNVAFTTNDKAIETYKKLYDRNVQMENWLKTNRGNPTALYPLDGHTILDRKQVQDLVNTNYQHLDFQRAQIATFTENANVMHNISKTYQQEMERRGLKTTDTGKQITPQGRGTGTEHLPGVRTGPPAPSQPFSFSGKAYSKQEFSKMTPAQRRAFGARVTAAGKQREFIDWLSK